MIKAFLLGVKDGKEHSYDLGSGLTWDTNQWFYRQKNWAYDMGVNFGQRHTKHPLDNDLEKEWYVKDGKARLRVKESELSKP